MKVRNGVGALIRQCIYLQVPGVCVVVVVTSQYGVVQTTGGSLTLLLFALSRFVAVGCLFVLSRFESDNCCEPIKLKLMYD